MRKGKAWDIENIYTIQDWGKGDFYNSIEVSR